MHLSERAEGAINAYCRRCGTLARECAPSFCERCGKKIAAEYLTVMIYASNARSSLSRSCLLVVATEIGATPYPFFSSRDGRIGGEAYNFSTANQDFNLARVSLRNAVLSGDASAGISRVLECWIAPTGLIWHALCGST